MTSASCNADLRHCSLTLNTGKSPFPIIVLTVSSETMGSCVTSGSVRRHLGVLTRCHMRLGSHAQALANSTARRLSSKDSSRSPSYRMKGPSSSRCVEVSQGNLHRGGVRADVRVQSRPVRYLVGAPKGRLNEFEQVGRNRSRHLLAADRLTHASALHAGEPLLVVIKSTFV
jgi:hypothetical protein